MTPVTREQPSLPARETRAAVAEITGTDPSLVRSYAVIVDDGTPEAVLTTDLGDLPLVTLLVEILRLLTGEATP